jgi:tetratricopeptide (TPR) repeat protein
VTGTELEKAASAQLQALRSDTAERTAKHLVMALWALEDDQDLALEHARFAASIGGRVAVTRETYGVIAYQTGDYKTASRELRTAMRISGSADLLPLIADTERGLGRPERALELAAGDEARRLDVEGTIELMIVVAGAYADTGDIETALRTLDMPALRSKVNGKWQVRLWAAYADLLERAGRADEAKRWLTLAADADTENLTDAAERLGRPVPVADPMDEAPWEDAESLSVLDAFDPSEGNEDDEADASDEDTENEESAPAGTLEPEDSTDHAPTTPTEQNA